MGGALSRSLINILCPIRAKVICLAASYIAGLSKGNCLGKPVKTGAAVVRTPNFRASMKTLRHCLVYGSRDLAGLASHCVTFIVTPVWRNMSCRWLLRQQDRIVVYLY